MPIPGIELGTFGIALAHELFMNTHGQTYGQTDVQAYYYNRYYDNLRDHHDYTTKKIELSTMALYNTLLCLQYLLIACYVIAMKSQHQWNDYTF